jgi:hypothetical protein
MHFSAIDAGRWQALRCFPTTTCAPAFKSGKIAAVRVVVPGDDGARSWQNKFAPDLIETSVRILIDL